MKRLFSIILSLVILSTSFSLGVEALAGGNNSNMYDNPFYSGKRKASYSQLYASSYASTPDYYTYNGVKYYSQSDTLYKIIRNSLAKRQEKITVNLYFPRRVYDFRSVIENLFVEATEDRLSICSTDGDYARWSVTQYGYDTLGVYTDSRGYYYKMNLVYKYYSTADEERQADNKINSIVSTVRKKDFSDYEAIRYIHNTIMNSTTYDYPAVDNPYKHMSSFSAYGALVSGKSVCQGYASAFYRICKELGYSVRFVSSSPFEGCHAWNLIRLDDKYYYVDVTWDDEISDNPEITDSMQTADADEYMYFLVDYDTLRCEDTQGQHTLYSELYDNDYFNKNYSSSIASQKYDFSTENGISTWRISLSSASLKYNGKEQKPSVTVKDKLGNPVSSYTASFGSNINCGRALVKITDNNSSANQYTYRSFNIVPGKMTGLKIASGERKNTSINFSWQKYANADGYLIQRYQNGKWVNVKLLGNVTSYNVTGLKPASTYKFRIVAYKIINNCRFYGDYSYELSTLTLPNTVATPTLSTKSGCAYVSWKRITCSGYQIQYSTSSSMSSAKTTGAASTTYKRKITGLKKGRRYYFRVRAYKTFNNKRYYSAWSGKKSIIIK